MEFGRSMSWSVSRSLSGARSYFPFSCLPPLPLLFGSSLGRTDAVARRTTQQDNESPPRRIGTKRHQQTLIVDVGHFSTRVGWSHEEEPRVTVTTGRLSVRDVIDNHLDDLGGGPFDNTRVCVTEVTCLRCDRQVQDERRLLARQLILDDGPGRFAGLHITSTAAMQLLSSGRRSGILVDIGHSLRVTPVYELAVLSHAVREMAHPTHEDCVDFILNLLPDLNTDNHPRKRAEEVRPHCSVAFHFKKEHQANKHGSQGGLAVHGAALKSASVSSSCQCSSSAFIISTTQQLAVPELYFQPDLLRGYVGGNRCAAEERPKGLPEVLVESVMSLEPHLRNLMFTNICIAGRGTLFPGFEDRLKMELASLLPSIYDVNVFRAKAQEDNLSAYVGALQFVRAPGFESACVSREDAAERYIEMVSYVF